jgi:integrase
MSLTNKSISQAISARKRVEITDPSCPGLLVVVTDTGAATFAVRYRGSDGGRRRLSLGRYGALSIEAARKLAREQLVEVANGRDPGAKKAIERSAMRMVDLFGDDEHGGWYLDTYVLTAGKGDNKGMPKTDKGIYNDRQIITKQLRSRKVLMRKRVDAVTEGDLLEIKGSVTRGVWPKVLNVLRVALEHAVEQKVITINIAKGKTLRAAPARKMSRYLTPAERQRLDTELERAKELGPSCAGGVAPHFVRAIRLLALTGWRRGDVLALKWEHIDWRNRIASLPTGKEGAREAKLTTKVLEYLRGEQKRDGVSRVKGYVVCSSTGCAVHPDNVGRAWIGIRKRCGLEDVRLHDLRHSWASDAISAGVPLAVVGAALGHRQATTTQRYAHVHDDVIDQGLELAAAAIDRATRRGSR